MMAISVEAVAVHDRLEVWPAGYDAPVSIVVSDIREGVLMRTLCTQVDTKPVEISVDRRHTVNMVC